MANEPTHESGREDRLNEILAEYLQALETGQTPDIDSLVAQHPDFADELLKQCLQKFYWLRGLPGLRKRPSTSELIDWIGALMAAGIPRGQIAEGLPFLGTLIKREEDLEVVERARRPTTARGPAWPR